MNNGNGNGNGHDREALTLPPPADDEVPDTEKAIRILESNHAPPREDLEEDPRDPKVPLERVIRTMAWRQISMHERMTELAKEMRGVAERVKTLEDRLPEPEVLDA